MKLEDLPKATRAYRYEGYANEEIVSGRFLTDDQAKEYISLKQEMTSLSRKALLADNAMLKAEYDRLKSAALHWWRGHRPLNYSAADHIRTPTINCSSDQEKDLALMCGALENKNAEDYTRRNV